MKKNITLLLFLSFINVFSQEKEGDRAGTIFYPAIERTDEAYIFNVDLYELGKAKYIEAELYDENEVKLTSKLLKLTLRDKKHYISEGEAAGKEVVIQDINFKLNNPDKSLSYPKVKIKILNANFEIIDYSIETFY